MRRAFRIRYRHNAKNKVTVVTVGDFIAYQSYVRHVDFLWIYFWMEFAMERVEQLSLILVSVVMCQQGVKYVVSHEWIRTEDVSWARLIQKIKWITPMTTTSHTRGRASTCTRMWWAHVVLNHSWPIWCFLIVCYKQLQGFWCMLYVSLGRVCWSMYVQTIGITHHFGTLTLTT